MAPKRSAGRGKSGEPCREDVKTHGWKSSKCSDSHLFGLIEEHLLQPRNVIHWRRSDGESFPHEGGNESFLMFFGVLVFPFLISSEVFFIIEGFRCIT